MDAAKEDDMCPYSWAWRPLQDSRDHGAQQAVQPRPSASRVTGVPQEGRDWAPRDLRHTFVSLLSDDGMAIEKIARLAGHASSHVTETVYRQELRPVLQEGAEVMDRFFGGVKTS